MICRDCSCAYHECECGERAALEVALEPSVAFLKCFAAFPEPVQGTPEELMAAQMEERVEKQLTEREKALDMLRDFHLVIDSGARKSTLHWNLDKIIIQVATVFYGQ